MTLVALVLLAGVFLSPRPPEAGLPGAGRFPIVGQRAPDFSLSGSTGSWRLSDHLGKPIVISFWTTWCGVCTRDLDVLERFRRQDGGAVEVASVCPENWGQVPRILAGHPVGFPVLYDPGARVTALYEQLPNLRYPFTVFIDQQGVVKGVWAVALRDVRELLELLARAGIRVGQG